MNVFLKAILAVYSFCVAVVAAIFMLMVFEHRILESIYYYLSGTVLDSAWAAVLMLVIALLFFVFSITFMLSGFKSGKNKKSVNKNTDIGQIRISLDTIESIALSASRKIIGVESTRASVEKADEDVSITVKMKVFPETNIPALSEDMQQEVKKAVEESSGIIVKDVQVVIEDISEPVANNPASSVKP